MANVRITAGPYQYLARFEDAAAPKITNAKKTTPKPKAKAAKRKKAAGKAAPEDG